MKVILITVFFTLSVQIANACTCVESTISQTQGELLNSDVIIVGKLLKQRTFLDTVIGKGYYYRNQYVMEVYNQFNGRLNLPNIKGKITFSSITNDCLPTLYNKNVYVLSMSVDTMLNRIILGPNGCGIALLFKQEYISHLKTIVPGFLIQRVIATMKFLGFELSINEYRNKVIEEMIEEYRQYYYS